MNLIFSTISVIVFVPLVFILLKIWRASKGGSLAFLYWAIGVSLFFTGYWTNFFYINFNYPLSWFLPIAAAIGGVYVFFGVVWYGTDTRLFKFKRESVIRLKNTFLILTLLLISFIVIFDFLGFLEIPINAAGRSIQLIFWFFALFFLWKITKESKFVLPWVLIFSGTVFTIPKIISFILLSLGMNGIISLIQLVSFLFEMGLWILGFFIYAKRAGII